jgi:release factor glutamine methyltransferase
MTIHDAQQKLLFRLYDMYDNGEAAAITNMVMEKISGWKRIDRVINKTVPLSMPQEELFKKYFEELSTYKPVQYVLHEAWFCNLKFYVDENVLIPRHETEELVEWVVQEVRSEKLEVGSQKSEVGSKKEEARNKEQDLQFEIQNSKFKILDVGTGSGCIPIALKNKLPDANIFSCDVSDKALVVAKRNALSNNVDINFFLLDFLDKEKRKKLPACNIIVSNPPYIPLNDKSSMPANVINFEPHVALFVNENDPLIFYNGIADFALEKLSSSGSIYAEIHEDLSSNVKELFLKKGFQNVTIKKDIHEKKRMLKATMLL